jgi:hypothetical protein
VCVGEWSEVVRGVGENGFDLGTGGGLIQPAFGVGLIRPPVVVCVRLTVMVV